MPRKKNERHEEINHSPYIIQTQSDKSKSLRGQRQQSFFSNKNPISLELACGRGEYTTGLSNIFPQQNFIGVDIKGERLRHGAQDAMTNRSKNVGFLRSKIHFLEDFFAEDEINQIRIIHPDPRPKGVDERRRLSYKRFLKIYEQILKPKGLVKLKTDDANLFFYSYRSFQTNGRTILDHTTDLYHSPLLTDHHGIITHYEQKFVEQGSKIHYLIAQSPKKA